ncbi:hypothetical protein BC628DRAFT_1340241 [Trametes gibbosa]|nr:hypothetical protein BC628DRAFT_1340241 [Trametes gibbosa]
MSHVKDGPDTVYADFLSYYTHANEELHDIPAVGQASVPPPRFVEDLGLLAQLTNPLDDIIVGPLDNITNTGPWVPMPQTLSVFSDPWSSRVPLHTGVGIAPSALSNVSVPSFSPHEHTDAPLDSPFHLNQLTEDEHGASKRARDVSPSPANEEREKMRRIEDENSGIQASNGGGNTPSSSTRLRTPARRSQRVAAGRAAAARVIRDTTSAKRGRQNAASGARPSAPLVIRPHTDPSQTPALFSSPTEGHRQEDVKICISPGSSLEVDESLRAAADADGSARGRIAKVEPALPSPPHTDEEDASAGGDSPSSDEVPLSSPRATRHTTERLAIRKDPSGRAAGAKFGTPELAHAAFTYSAPPPRKSAIEAKRGIARCIAQLGTDPSAVEADPASGPPSSGTGARKRLRAGKADEKEEDTYEGSSADSSDDSDEDACEYGSDDGRTRKRPRSSAAKVPRAPTRRRRSKRIYPAGPGGPSYSRDGDRRRRAISELHGRVQCSFCQPMGLKGGVDRTRLSRLPDTAYRHLRKCVAFQSTQYYRDKLVEKPDSEAAPGAEETVHGGKAQAKSCKRATEKVASDANTEEPATGVTVTEPTQEDVKRAVKKTVEEKMMIVQVHCQNDRAYRARARRLGVMPKDVEAHVARYATIYKVENCKCCPYPHYASFRKRV